MRFNISLLFVLLTSTCFAQLSIIPQPLEVKQQTGLYLLKNNITVSSNLPGHEWPGLFKYLKDELKKQFGITATETAKGKKGDIDFFMIRMPTSGKPAYQLFVDKNGIEIKSNFAEPRFHAIQTLLQLIPLTGKKEIPFVEIFDHARFEYRGMHLDVARHFFPVSFIKKYIDYLAYHKFNTFHWHLTDDQGWRIEIKKYPQLTSVGGWRNGTIIGRYPGTVNDGKKYGGFYTQEQVKEVVKYATERFITVIPEIEMPGHASAAIAAYPMLSCFPNQQTDYPKQCAWSGPKAGKQVQQTWGVFDDVFCAGKESTFTFLEDVMKEILPLFPSKYIHVGGDESPKTHWKKCPACQKRMTDNKLKDEHELQSYFIQRMERFLNSKDRTLIGWDEILEGGLAPNAIVMSWRGEKGGIDAAKEKHRVIMTPGNPVYFDHTQSENEDSVTIGGFNPLEKVYAYEPVPKELSTEEAKYVWGAQANLWTEYIKNTKKAEYMLFPRMSALSEVLWSTKENRDWEKFQKKLLLQFKRYDLWKANYSNAYFALRTSIIPTDNFDGVIWRLEYKNSGEGCYYCQTNIRETLVLKRDSILFDTIGVADKNDPTLLRFQYEKIQKKAGEQVTFFTLPYHQSDTLTAVLIKESKTINAWQQRHHIRTNKIEQKFLFNKATGKKINLTLQADSKYPGDGAFTLVNGVINEKGFARTKEFIGFSGENCEAIIDLGIETEISSVVINAMKRPTSWIWEPAAAEAIGSADGVTWRQLQQTTSITLQKGEKVTLDLLFKKTSVRFVKVVVKNWGVIPEGNPGAGNKAWLFVDEIEVN